MTRVQIDPAATDGFGAAVAEAGTRVRGAVTALTGEVASLPADATCAAGAEPVLAAAERASNRFASEAVQLRDLLALAAALARRADYEHASGFDDGLLLHQALAIDGQHPDMTPAVTRLVCAGADAVGWVKFPDPGPGAGHRGTLAAVGETLVNGAESLLSALAGRSSPAGTVLGSVASVGQLLCADTGYRGRDAAPKRAASQSTDASWRDPEGGDGREDRHANPAGSTGAQMPDTFLGLAQS